MNQLSGSRSNACKAIIIAGLVTLAFSSSAYAADDFSKDFGKKAIEWIAFGTTNPVWGTRSLLSVISEVINFFALVVMAWLAVLAGSSFVIHTANKGVPGGQVISSFWAPLRICVATILLIPLTSGYSTLQYGVINVAESGNDSGNYLMGKGLNYLYDFGAYRSPGLEDGRSAILSWIGSELCMQYINSYTGKEQVSANIKHLTEDGRYVTKVSYGYNEEKTWYWSSNPRTDYCGAITFSVDKGFMQNSDSAAQLEMTKGQVLTAAAGGPAMIAASQQELVKDILPKVRKIASMLLTDEAALRSLQKDGASAQSTYEKAVAEVNGKISEASKSLDSVVRDYNALTQKSIASAVNKLNTNKNNLKNSNPGTSPGDWRDQTMAMGWPALGTIFWQININQSAINKLAASMSATVTLPQLDDEWLKDQRLTEISGRIRGLMKASAGTASISSSPDNIPSLSGIADAGAEGDGIIDKIKSTVYGAFAGLMRSMLYKNSPDDMIINLQYFGSAAGTFAEVGWWSKTIGTSLMVGTMKAAEDQVSQAQGYSWYNPVGWVANLAGSPAKGVIAGVSHFVLEVSSLLNYLITALLFVGFLLGVVLPTIPLTSWFMGVVSWLCFYIECLLVSPIWLSAHGTAERDGWGSEHTRQGYMLMIGLYLNPILRVAGFFAIFLLLKPAAYLVSWFIDYLQGVVVSGFTMFYIMIGALIVSGIFAYNLLTRIFNVPSELFERGLRWVNGGQEVTGDGANEEKTRSNMIAFGHSSKVVAGGMRPAAPNPGASGGGKGASNGAENGQGKNK